MRQLSADVPRMLRLRTETGPETTVRETLEMKTQRRLVPSEGSETERAGREGGKREAEESALEN